MNVSSSKYSIVVIIMAIIIKIIVKGINKSNNANNANGLDCNNKQKSIVILIISSLINTRDIKILNKAAIGVST
jgi:hypothetical protein